MAIHTSGPRTLGSNPHATPPGDSLFRDTWRGPSGSPVELFEKEYALFLREIVKTR